MAKTRKPVTLAAIDRAVQALERLIEAPDAKTCFGGYDLHTLDRARTTLLRGWSNYKWDKEG